MAEVEVDSETGQVTLQRLVTAQDVGTIINELGHQGQINGAIVQGIGYAMMEELIVEDGRVTTPNFADYKIPTVRDIPELVTVNVPDNGDRAGSVPREVDRGDTHHPDGRSDRQRGRRRHRYARGGTARDG